MTTTKNKIDTINSSLIEESNDSVADPQLMAPSLTDLHNMPPPTSPDPDGVNEKTPLFSAGTSGANPIGNFQSGAERRIAFYLLSTTLLIFGTQNSLILKYQSQQDFLCDENGRNCTTCPENPSDGTECLSFEQPYYQAFTMFVGQSFCFLLYYILNYVKKYKLKKNGLKDWEEEIPEGSTIKKFRGFRILLAWIPCLFDILAQVMQNAGLILTYVSVYQMLRGAIVLFTGTFARIFLQRRQYAFHWIAMVLIVIGVVIVGLASVLFTDPDDSNASNPLLGDILILSAQIFAAAQFVAEDYIMDRYLASPMHLVGLQGVFGVLFWLVVLPIMQVTGGNNGDVGNYMDLKWAFYIFANFNSITVSSIMYAVGIILTNTSGLWITKIVSATSRATIDTFRTMFVWGISLALGWEIFLWLQIVGFVILVLGTMFYNEVIRIPFMDYSHVTSAFEDIVTDVTPQVQKSLDEEEKQGYK